MGISDRTPRLGRKTLFTISGLASQPFNLLDRLIALECFLNCRKNLKSIEGENGINVLNDSQQILKLSTMLNSPVAALHRVSLENLLDAGFNEPDYLTAYGEDPAAFYQGKSPPGRCTIFVSGSAFAQFTAAIKTARFILPRPRSRFPESNASGEGKVPSGFVCGTKT
jgi:hypothetical protein